MKLRLYTMVLGAAALCLAACSSDETGDETGTGGSGDGGTGVGATGGGTGNSGNEGGTGNTGNEGGTGVGGGGDCFTCAGYITDCIAGDPPAAECATQDTCAGESTDLFNALADCACAACETECAETCAGGMTEEPGCAECQMGAIGGDCSDEFASCSGDA